jgi:hypothetical protein
MVKKFTLLSILILFLLPVLLLGQVEKKIDSVKKEVVQSKPSVEQKKTTMAAPVESMMVITVETELCSGIEERMPTGMADSFPAGTETVYLWCKVLGAMDSTSIMVNWYYHDSLMAEVQLPVRSSSWRTWSSKNLLPSWVGDWTVKVLDAAGTQKASVPFKIVKSE